MPERIAILGDEGPICYDDLYTSACRIGSAIEGHDRAQRIAWLGLNRPEFARSLFAAALAGRPFVPLNYRLKDDELRALAARCAPCLLFADNEFASRVTGIAGVEVVSTSSLKAFARDAVPIEEIPGDSSEVAVQLFTSGTTGTPKAALLRHQNLSSYIVNSVEFMSAEPNEGLLVSVPPYHIAAIAAVLSSTFAGRRLVQLPAFSPETWVDLAHREKITHAMLVPTMLGRVLRELGARGESLNELHHLSYGGGQMPLPVIEKALELLPHVDFVNAYGLTETSSTISVLGPEDHRLARLGDAKARRRLASVGRPLPNLEVSIRDDAGEPLAAGAVGEIWVRGEQVSGEYAGSTARRPDGWLPTRDSGWADEDGFLFVQGRLDDVIVRGGENISPGEIEEVLCAHPCVEQAAVVGIPDTEWGERIVAAVVANAEVEAEQLKDWVRERLRSTKTPEEVFFYRELPHNETGKLLRRVLRNELSRPV